MFWDLKRPFPGLKWTNGEFGLPRPQNQLYKKGKTQRAVLCLTTGIQVPDSGKTPKGQMVPFSVFKSAKRQKIQKIGKKKTPKGQMVPFSRMYKGEIFGKDILGGLDTRVQDPLTLKG